MRLSRSKTTGLAEDSPRTKTNKLLKYWHKRGPTETVRKTLNFHYALLKNMKDQYQNNQDHRTKQKIKKLVCGKILRKYRCLYVARKALGLYSGRRPTKSHRRRNDQIRTAVVAFYSRDDVSRMGAGKKNTITVRKIKKQRRILVDSLINLHMRFLSETNISVSYAMFCRLRPFWVVLPTERDRDTCLCMTHENYQYIVEKMFQQGLICTKDMTEIVSNVVCNTTSKDCAYGDCENCKLTEYPIMKKPGDAVVSLFQWERQKVPRVRKESEEVSEAIITVKVTNELTESDFVGKFLGGLSKFIRHVYNIRWQFAMYRRVRENLRNNECLIHIDFSECRYNFEVQSVHFGASRQQACLHTGVYYVLDSPEPTAFCSISDSTRHDPPAIWAHMEPVLEMIHTKYPLVDTLHFWSDSPTTQYRQKGNFHLLSTEPFQKGFNAVTWNFFEAGHGKGAPDGVGGSLKRTADRLTRQGRDIEDPMTLYCELVGESSVKLFFITKGDVEAKSIVLSSAGALKPVKGTMQLHQVTCLSLGMLKVREVSGFCSSSDGILECDCFHLRDACVLHQPVQTDSKSRMPTHRPKDITIQHMGQWCVVEYDGQAYPGIIQVVEDNEFQVKCMRSAGPNRFFWPACREDVNWYEDKQILCLIQEPTYASRRHVMIEAHIWREIQKVLP